MDESPIASVSIMLVEYSGNGMAREIHLQHQSRIFDELRIQVEASLPCFPAEGALQSLEIL